MRFLARHFLLSCTACAIAVHAAPASTAAAPPEDVPLAAYLDTLRAVAPAARDGADAYLAAHRQRCGRPMTVTALRAAVANGDGEPVLMAMMRAASVRDAAALQRLAQAVPCTGPR